jgi:hypothetical protein
MKTWIIRFKKEALCEVSVEAETEAEARKKFDEGDVEDDELEIEGINIDIQSVEENE